jgi:acyl-CoA reductase-like NAD-dependent aldehyde dehydrogenase
MINDCKYGLTGIVFTQSMERMAKLAPEIQAGTVFMNRCDYLDPELPWTGVKDTGKGVTLSRYGFRSFYRLKGYHIKLLQ